MKAKILVCGGRTYRDRVHVFTTLDSFEIDHVVCGGAFGVDAIAEDWARQRCVPVTVYMADWERYGRKAGPLRNRAMLTEKPTAVIAFPGGAGTANMIAQAEAAGINVIRIKKA